MIKLKPQVVVPLGTPLPNIAQTDLTSDEATLNLATAALVVVDYLSTSLTPQLLLYVEQSSDGSATWIALTTARQLAQSPITGFAFDVRRALWLSEPNQQAAQLIVNLAEVTNVSALRRIRVQLRDVGDFTNPGSVGVTILSSQ